MVSNGCWPAKTPCYPAFHSLSVQSVQLKYLILVQMKKASLCLLQFIRSTHSLLFCSIQITVKLLQIILPMLKNMRCHTKQQHWLVIVLLIRMFLLPNWVTGKAHRWINHFCTGSKRTKTNKHSLGVTQCLNTVI